MNTYLHRKLFVSEYLLCVCTICTLCALLTPLVALLVKEEEVEEESQTGFGVFLFGGDDDVVEAVCNYVCKSNQRVAL